jgi:hypothetical protein
MNANNRFSSGRRKVLIGAAGAVITGAVAWLPLRNYRATWIEQVVRDNLPGINLDPDSLQTFVKSMLGHERRVPRSLPTVLSPGCRRIFPKREKGWRGSNGTCSPSI